MSNTIIIDNGTLFTRAGFSDDEEPRVIFPTAHSIELQNENEKPENPNFRFLEEFCKPVLNNEIQVKFPVEKGRIIDFEAQENIWKNLFEKHLKMDSKDKTIFFCQRTPNPNIERKDLQKERLKVAEIFFEKFGVEKFLPNYSYSWQMMTCMNQTGLIIDIGYDVSQITPVLYQKCLSDSVTEFSVNGKRLTEHFIKLIRESQQFNENDLMNQTALNSYKEKNCFISEDGLISEMKSKEFKLPDGNTIHIGQEACKVGELLFDEKEGIISAIKSALKDTSLEDTLLTNIILEGGTAQMNGFNERMEFEAQKLGKEYKLGRDLIQVQSFPDLTFTGGLVASNVSYYQDLLISKSEYEEGKYNKLDKDLFEI